MAWQVKVYFEAVIQVQNLVNEDDLIHGMALNGVILFNVWQSS